MNRDDIVNKKFSKSVYGYDMREVDAFLDELAKQAELCERETELDKIRIKTLMDELESRKKPVGDQEV